MRFYAIFADVNIKNQLILWQTRWLSRANFESKRY